MIYVVLISVIVLFPYHNSDICSANIFECVISISYSAYIRDCVFVHIIIMIIVVLISAIMLFPYHNSYI